MVQFLQWLKSLVERRTDKDPDRDIELGKRLSDVVHDAVYKQFEMAGVSPISIRKGAIEFTCCYIVGFSDVIAQSFGARSGGSLSMTLSIRTMQRLYGLEAGEAMFMTTANLMKLGSQPFIRAMNAGRDDAHVLNEHASNRTVKLADYLSQRETKSWRGGSRSTSRRVNLLWRINPKLLAKYDRAMARHLVSEITRETCEIVGALPLQPNPDWQSEAWLLAASIVVDAYERAGGKNGSDGIGGFWSDLGASLILHFSTNNEIKGFGGVRHQTVGDYFRQFVPIVEARYVQYARAIENDLQKAATSNFFWSGELKVRIAESVLKVSPKASSQEYDLAAFEVGMAIMSRYKEIIELFQRPSLWHMFSLPRTGKDTFWVTYRPPGGGDQNLLRKDP